MTAKYPTYAEQETALGQALAFLDTASPQEGVSYAWVLDYAKTLWEHRLRVQAILDEKTEAIIRYLGGGTGLFAFGILAKIDANTVYLAGCSLPSICCSLVAIGLALYARRPGPFPALPTVESAKGYADEYKTPDAAAAAFAAQWNLASERARVVLQRKADSINRAMWCTYAALVFLLIPLLAAMRWPPHP